MKPDLREALSCYLDDELSPGGRASVEEELARSEEARSYLTLLETLRRHVRYEAVADQVDVVPAVLEAVRPQPRRATLLRLGAAFAAGAAIAAIVVGFSFRRPPSVAAEDIPGRVVGAQSEVVSLFARLDIVERGLHPLVPERTFTGTVAYNAPESIHIALEDTTVYPSSDWVRNDTDLVVESDFAWERGPAGCPVTSLPDCTPQEPRVVAVRGREPFSTDHPAPLDVIVPARAFLRQGDPAVLGVARLDDTEAIGVEVSVAQVSALLEGLIGPGNYRDVHPTDRVELWLDRVSLTPLALAVYPADSEQRRLWAIRNGYVDGSGAVIEVVWSGVEINARPAVGFPEPPAEAADAGYVVRPVEQLAMPVPAAVPEGMAVYRPGAVDTAAGPAVMVAAWSDGRSWLKVRFTSEWDGDRLFGDLGRVVRQVPLGEGVGYVDERGERVAVHAAAGDMVVEGSLQTDDLVAVAASLGVAGIPVPAGWPEASSRSLEAAAAQVPGLLVPTIAAFGDPTVNVGDGVATLAYAGQGNRGFRLAQALDSTLPPPLDSETQSVGLRRTEARYSPQRGRLEWVENGLAVTISTTSLSLEEMVAIAESLEPA